MSGERDRVSYRGISIVTEVQEWAFAGVNAASRAIGISLVVADLVDTPM
jgi:hypothetical protein